MSTLSYQACPHDLRPEVCSPKPASGIIALLLLSMRRCGPDQRHGTYDVFSFGVFSFGNGWRISMAKKRKKKTFSAATTVREMARERVGSPKPSHPVPAKKTKPEKHKPTLGKLLGEE
jgi:hypothetical protein